MAKVMNTREERLDWRSDTPTPFKPRGPQLSRNLMAIPERRIRARMGNGVEFPSGDQARKCYKAVRQIKV
jgi:hypothetical protein